MKTGKRDREEIIDKQVVSSKKQKVVQGGVADEESCDEEPQAVKKPQATGSKTLIMANLSSQIQEVDVINFFKSAGKVVEVRFIMRDGQFANYGTVEFATPEAAQEARKLDKRQLLDRPVILHLEKETCAFPSPGSGGNERSFQHGQGKTVFVKGFGTDDKFDSVRLSLEKHFGQCGIFVQMIIVELYKSGGVKKGDAFIYFNNRAAVIKALKLNGSDVGGCTITVEEAKQPKARSVESSDGSSSEKEKDSSSEEEEEKPKKNDGDVEMADAPSAPQATGSKTLFMGSLSSQIQEADVINFFKSVGGVVNIHLVKKDDQFEGYGFVEFATPEAAQEASKLHKEPLLDIPVILDLVAETGTFTPGSGGNEMSFQKGEGKIVFVRGFGADIDKFDNVSLTRTLVKHFRECGMISRIDFSEFYESGGLKKADCFIKFNESAAVVEALKLNGSDVGGCTITVEVSKPKARGDGGGGSGHGFDGSRSGGPGTGKKTTFGDE